MKAVGYFEAGPIDRPDALVDIDIPAPVPGENDLLVEIRAISVNPVDARTRASVAPERGAARILGWDAAGIVAGMGARVEGFAPGDRVYYAGSIARPGSNAEFGLVDYRIAAKAPASLTDAEAAALPLTTITAWEALFDRLDVACPVPGATEAVLVIGGAGGVGSMAIQLLRACTDLAVIATASRPASQDWCTGMGAHFVIDHGAPLAPQVAALGLGRPGFVFSTSNTDGYVADIAELIAPQGRIAAVDSPPCLDVMPFKRKALTFVWEAMFIRALEQTPDMAHQGALLARTAELIDKGALRSTLTRTVGRIDAKNLILAHRAIETRTTNGKIVLEGF